MSFKCFFNSHFVFVSQIHISFLQGNSFRFAVITFKKMKANTWKTILQIAISILTAIATTLGVTSCMG